MHIMNSKITMSLNTKRVILLHTMTTTGYIIMLLLVGCIMYLWFHEWRELEVLEAENRRINDFRQEVHHVYGELTGLSFFWAKPCWSGTMKI